MYGHYGKAAVSQRTSLIEHHRINLRQQIQIVGTFYQHTFSGCSAYTTKEGKGYADNQSAGTTDYEEHQCTIEPGGEHFDK